MEGKSTTYSSSSSPPAKSFDVFLSFRGEDTRNNFTGHLSFALRKIGLFNIFKDDYALEKGKDIWPELKSSIEDAQYAVVVLSENYATSSWCLRELAKIVKCARNESLKIRTIFYHVNPSDVRNVKSRGESKQKGSFWEAMEAHKQNPSNSVKTLEKWRNALFTVANQSGYPVEAQMDEAIFIEEFVTKISSELGASIRTIEGLFGMSSRLKELDSYVLQSSATNNVCFIGIHGMGGIGKSTLARAYYKRMSHKFDGSSFLQNIREVCEKKANDLVDLQKHLLSDILKDDFIEIRHYDNGIDMIRSRLRHKKVLVVLDDVCKLEQLNGLAGEDEWFGLGSVIIVTTREDSFLKIKRYTIYRAEYLNQSEALQLFSSKAFGSIEPPEEYKELSKLVVEYASCLPLALKILGSLLGSKKTSEWESALRRLRKFPEKEIVEKLKISFDDLNEIDQRIFLDIACFFCGFEKDYAVQILDSCDFDSEYGISNLIDKSLLSIQKGKIWMHDLIQEMGKEIVRKESGNQPQRQSRIWDTVDLYNIFENKEGTNEVEAIVAYTDKNKECSFEALSSMKKLRLLKFEGLDDCDGLDDFDGLELSNNLQYLVWSGFPYNRLPSSFQPRKLVQLQLRHSNIKQLWNNDVKPLYNLKVIDISSSQSFTKFEDFTVVPNLEKLILFDCRKLPEIHPSIKCLKKLILLNLGYCSSLENLPEEINGLTSLQTLKLYGCCKLRQLPDNLEQLKSLRDLDITGSHITHLPSSIFLMENLEFVHYHTEEIIKSHIRENIISNEKTGAHFIESSWFCRERSFYSQVLLTRLDLIDCNLSGPEAFPEYFGKLVSLRYLDLSKNPFSILPPGINGLYRLKGLRLEHCKSLRCLEPELLPSSLQVIYVNYCTSLASFLDPLKPCHLRFSAQFCFDCTELVKRQDGKMTALASLRRFLEIPSNRRLQFEVALPLDHPRCDYELPDWFLKQSSTEPISIKLDPNRHNCKLKGFAMVFCFDANSSGNDFCCDLRVGCSENWKITMVAYKISIPIINSRRLDHLFLLYMPRDKLYTECINQLESPSCDKLEFSLYSKMHNACSCGPFGVRLVYEEDIEDMLNEITRKYCSQSLHQKDHVHSSDSESISGLSEVKHLDLEDSLD